MTNTELHDKLSFIRTACIEDNVSVKITDLIFELMRTIRPELYAVCEKGFSYEPEYFTMQEFTNSVTAQKLKLRNTIPNEMVRDNILSLIKVILDPARRTLGKPIYVSSGYRSQTLNKAVGGVNNSKHLHGLAADVSCYDNDRLFDILNALPHSELIYHYPIYIHVAL